MTAFHDGTAVALIWLGALPTLLWWGDQLIRRTSLVVGGYIFACAALPGLLDSALPPISLFAVETLLFLFLMHLVYSADRKFPMILAAVALIGLIARALQQLSLVIAEFEMLTLTNEAGLLLLFALLVATAALARRNRIKQPETIAPEGSLR
ncbi:MAG: hypothetical protein ABL912_06925 [Novosphingobium sp.]